MRNSIMMIAHFEQLVANEGMTWLMRPHPRHVGAAMDSIAVWNTSERSSNLPLHT